MRLRVRSLLPRALAALVLGAGFSIPAPAQVAAAPPVDFVEAVRPIFADACVACHGPEKQKGGLRLDVKTLAMDGGTSGKSILPGRGGQSPLVRRLRGEGGEDRMTLTKEALSEAQIALVTRWIDQGAPWPEGAAGAGAVKHWAFVPPARPAEPAVADAAWPRNPIDRFVLARLERQGLRPSPEAPRATLLRRANLDLVGLPPAPAEIDAFLADPSPEAYDKQVDRLLASPHYGERWGRHWLDGARYADSSGYSIDAPRTIWPYRDWVIDALNRDLPFDRFAVEQLAGDLLPGASTPQRVATGFHRNTQLNEEGGIDKEQFRVESVIDRVATTGAVFLGLTVGCAQCHNHKFDPISQREYYQFFAFFNNADEPKLTVGGEGTTTLVMAERPEPRQSYIFTKGDFTRRGDPVEPGVPAVLPPLKGVAGAARPNRLDLARWIVDPANPLTARVQVNRLWMHYFGKGLVETENDFGTQGSPPTHPELLDWLASEFVGRGWSLKRLHRLVATSATYRQSSNARADLARLDPYNTLLGRQARVRLDAEIVRDQCLAAGGLLSEKVGGPSVFPPQPEGVMGLGQVKRAWKPSAGADRYRRGIYTFAWRSTPHPLMTSFDGPDTTSACTRRPRSNTPLQALTLLNDAAFIECAQALAGRVLSEGPGDESARLAYAFRLCTGRPPAPDEARILADLLARERDAFARAPAEAAALAAGRPGPGTEPTAFAAWTIVSRALLNLDETITRE